MTKKNNYTYHKDGANLSVIKIDASHCFCCGKTMASNSPDDVKTKHHAIPEEMKPVRNIIVPLCRKCHRELHQSASMTAGDNRIKKKMESMRKNYEAFGKTIDNFEKELNKE